jgi:hypothetical protein
VLIIVKDWKYFDILSKVRIQEKHKRYNGYLNVSKDFDNEDWGNCIVEGKELITKMRNESFKNN